MLPLHLHSATRLARLIRAREVTAREVVEAHIARIEATAPVLNAVVATRFDEARREADQADLRLQREDGAALPPLLGVPCTIKESFALTGMPQSSGLFALRDRRATKDATTVARLRAAGAIPLGVTNVSELCMWMESDNRVYGRSNNPYDPSRIVGGSSGGEGAIVGAGASPFGLGADIGGSIRLPAFFNGVFGHKPTGGLVPGTGQLPLAENKALRFLSTGPLARRAEDLMPLLRLLAGPDGEDRECEARQLGDPHAVQLAGLRVLDIPGNGAVRVSRELQEAQRRVAGFLAAQGARVEEVRVPALKNSFDIWGAMMNAEATTSFRQLLGNGRPVNVLLELCKAAFGRSVHTVPALMLAAFERVPKWLPEREKRMALLGRQLRAELTALVGDGVLLYPSYATVAPRHGRPLFPPLHWVYTAILNVLEFPSTQVPLGLNAEGLPLGIQVAAAPGNDHLTIGVALQLERQFGGWVPPPERR